MRYTRHLSMNVFPVFVIIVAFYLDIYYLSTLYSREKQNCGEKTLI